MNRKLIERFLKRNYSEDSQKIKEWLVNHAEHEVDTLLKQHWEAVDKTKSLDNIDFELIYQQILNERENDKKVRELQSQQTNSVISWSRRPVWRSVTKYAAIILVALGLGYFVFLQQDLTMFSVQGTTMVEKVTPRGQKSTIFLNDSSKIILNSESSISYMEPFTHKREIILEGEAFFQVTRDTLRPFIVHTGNTITTVLGTAFNIENSRNEELTNISLLTGEVSVAVIREGKTQSREYVLSQNERVSISGSSSQLVKVEKFDPEEVLSWKDGVLFFKRASLIEIITELERWYDVKIHVDTPPENSWRYTGSFKDMSLELVLQTIAFTESFDFAINDKQVILKF